MTLTPQGRNERIHPSSNRQYALLEKDANAELQMAPNPPPEVMVEEAAVTLSGLTWSHVACSTAAPQDPHMRLKPLVREC